ncbi:MAG: apolipoprotein N-acyltransferase [Deltaproteobacteria bacterium GWA2_50_8]|nr:MAG: apolipoprotein N-acyltransferase [Deltaproteobacteria bacterium GWA2_50_8]
MLKSFLKRDWFLALLSGFFGIWILPVSIGNFSTSGFDILAWIVFTPLFLAIWESPPRRTFLLVGLTHMIYFSGVSYWLNIAIHQFGGLPLWSSLLIMLLLVVIKSSLMGGFFALGAYWNKKLNLSWILLAPLLWVVEDYTINYIPAGGFPWGNIAYSQSAFVVMIQMLDLVGVYGVGFLIILINVTLTAVVRSWLHLQLFPYRAVLTTLILLILTLTYGFFRFNHFENTTPKQETLNVAYIQGNISQGLKWEETLQDRILSKYQFLSQKALEESSKPVDLIVYPETAYPHLLRHSKLNRVESFVKVPSLWGLNTFDADPTSPFKIKLFNSALLLDEASESLGIYHKTHLVPMGEYVPLKKIFFFVDKIVPGFMDFTPGRPGQLLRLHQKALLGVTICYEDSFPEISRSFVKNGADLLINITNDAWYGKSSAPYQHLTFSQFRAVETRRWLVRSTNTGVSAVVDPLGRFYNISDIFTEAFAVTTVGLGGALTFYTAWGDILVYVCLLVMSWLGIKTILIIYRERSRFKETV